MKSRLLRNTALVGYVLLATCVLLELAVRFWGYSERHIYDPIYTPGDQADIPYIHKANLVNARPRGMAVINTDSLGLRAGTAGLRYDPKQTNEYRIAIVGDSITFGEGVPNTEDTFASVLEQTLNAQQRAVKVSVFNYGASAYSVKQMAATLQSRMLQIEPDLVLMAIIPDDFDLTRTPAVDASGYLVDTRLSGINPSFPTLRRVIRSVRLSYVLRDVMYAMSPIRLDIPKSLAQGVLPDTYAYVQRFAHLADERGVPSIIVLLPTPRADLSNRVSRELRNDGITFLDLAALLGEFTRDQHKASQFDGHPSPAVHHRIGVTLAKAILETHLKSVFNTQPQTP